jgi:hypothetical protein
MADETPRYERSDFHPRVVGLFFIGLAVLCIGAGLVIWLFQKDLNRFFGYRGTASWTSSPRMMPPSPQLQADPRVDLAGLRAKEDVVLQNYGWVDRPNGVIRVPIDVAMRMLVERGVPTRKSPPVTSKPAP